MKTHEQIVERDARIADARKGNAQFPDFQGGFESAAEEIAAAIRQQEQQKVEVRR